MVAGRFRIVLAVVVLFVVLAVRSEAEPPLIERSLAQLRQTPPVANESFDFVVLGDSNTLKPLEQSEVFRQCLREFNILKPNFVVEVGDLILGGPAAELPAQWDLFEETIRTCRVPYLVLPGNHDVRDAASEALWKQRIGPTRYAFSYGNSLFLLLDSEELDAVQQISDEQVAWVRQQLDVSKATNIFVFLHQPYFEPVGDPDNKAAYLQRHWSNVADVFRGHPVKAVFAGHRHGYRDCGTREGVHYVITGGAASYGLAGNQEEGGFNHYLLVRVRGEEVSWSVIKPNAVLPENVSNSGRMDELFNVRNKWVRGEELIVPFGQAVDQDLRVTVTNPRPTPMQSSLRWEDPPGWSVTPQEAAYEVAGNSAKEFTFHVKATAEAARFPVPFFRTRYPQTEFGPPVEVQQDLKLVPTLSAPRARRPLVIDGVLDDWKDVPMTALGYPVDFSGDPNDLASKLAFQWDDNYLYLAIVTEDNEFYQPYAGDPVWSADNVEMFLDGWSWGLTLTGHGPEVFCYWGVEVTPEKVNTDVKLAVTRHGTQVIYEAAFPQSHLTPLKLAAGNSFRFNMLMNDLDPSGPVKTRHGLQLLPGKVSPGNPKPRAKVILEAANASGR